MKRNCKSLLELLDLVAVVRHDEHEYEHENDEHDDQHEAEADGCHADNRLGFYHWIFSNGRHCLVTWL